MDHSFEYILKKGMNEFLNPQQQQQQRIQGKRFGQIILYMKGNIGMFVWIIFHPIVVVVVFCRFFLLKKNYTFTSYDDDDFVVVVEKLLLLIHVLH